ncbi:L-cystine transport system permease protein [Treponema rectale]|uniref:L-cystine transport system permease protein n=1 Tax=Treponema rectale TaxID=744512 RepID=A0A840SGS4_9SPIR|nr:amino acid ABC transporter permease [Treponema rectale]MBB5219940.1 L-cystine transport system permease protein [Treponema rectale]
MNLDYGFMVSIIPVVVKALPVTLELTVISLLLASVIALVFGTVLIRKVFILNKLVLFFNTFLKGVPLIVQLLFCYYAIPYVLEKADGIFGWHYDPRAPSYFAFAVVAFAFNYGAYLTDVVVSSYGAVDKGQYEAACAVGMTPFQAMIHIVVPQALVISLPNLGNYFMWLLKATSLASVVNVFEMLSVAKASTAENYAILEGYLVAAGVYWIVCFFAEKLISKLNVRMKRC